MAEVMRYLRKAGCVPVFGWTKLLWERGDMVECDSTGLALNPMAEASILRMKSDDDIVELDSEPHPVLPSTPTSPVVFASETPAPGEPESPPLEEVIRKRRGKK